ncbi:MAG: hypothetical protein JNL28_09325 [Planctomycetes bacterium]|nr:hypothetical protein [Planctomycetota bacterium]
MRLLTLAPIAIAALAVVAHASDILILKDGRIFESDTMVRVEGAIDITFKNGVVRVPMELIQDAVLAADATIPPGTAEERDKAEKGMVRYEGKWVTTQRRSELIAKKLADKKADLQSIREHGEWRNRYIEETKAFRYEYTIPPHVFAEFKDAMEAYYSLFVKAWKINVKSGTPKLPVNIYLDEKSYHQVSGAPGGALAYFRFVKPWDLNTYYERLDPDFSKQVLYHEANHYLQLLVDTSFAVPHFPGEALAEYYGASRWDPATKKFETGLIQEGRLCEIQTDIAGGEKVTLETLITTEGMYQHYTWGWSLVHFLMNDSRYDDKFQKFFFALSKSRDAKREQIGRDGLSTMKQSEVWKLFRSELGLKDADAVRKLEVDWYNYIDQKLVLVTESGLGKAGFAASDTGRKIRAQRLFKEAIDKGSKNALVFHRYAELLDAEGKASEARAMLEAAIALNPLEGKFYNSLGHRLKMRNDPEGSRWIALGEELGYEDNWIDLSEVDPKGKGKDKGN